MPRARRRMRSAMAKSRRRRAALRSSISLSISSIGTGGCSSSARRREMMPERRVEQRERVANRRQIAASELAGVDGRVERSDQLEDRPERPGGVEVALHAPRRTPAALPPPCAATCSCAPSARHRLDAGQEIENAAERLLRLRQARPGEVQLLAIVRRQQQVAHRRRPVALGRRDPARCRCCRATSTSSGRRRAGTRRAPRSARTAARSPLRSARSRSRGAETRGRCRPRGCRSAARRAGAAPSPSTRDASRAGPADRPHPRSAHPAWSPSTGRSRARPPCRSCRSRRARRRACLRDRAAPACRSRAASQS